MGANFGILGRGANQGDRVYVADLPDKATASHFGICRRVAHNSLV